MSPKIMGKSYKVIDVVDCDYVKVVWRNPAQGSSFILKIGGTGVRPNDGPELEIFYRDDHFELIGQR